MSVVIQGGRREGEKIQRVGSCLSEAGPDDDQWGPSAGGSASGPVSVSGSDSASVSGSGLVAPAASRSAAITSSIRRDIAIDFLTLSSRLKVRDGVNRVWSRAATRD